jgi:asparagine synthase (glutamine-hydrolysing)
VRCGTTSALLALARATDNRMLHKAAYRAEVLAKETVESYVDYYAIWKDRLPRTGFYLTKEDLYTKQMKDTVAPLASVEYMRDILCSRTVPAYGHMNRAMLADVVSRLPEDYLMKVDFGAMRYGLETRPPFLDYRFVEYSLSLPEQYKIHGSTVKSMWKDIVSPRLPRAIVHRRKMGFGIPIAHWMRNELREYTRERLLTPDPLFHAYMNRTTLERLFNDHLEHKADYSNHLWSCVLLREWLASIDAS